MDDLDGGHGKIIRAKSLKRGRPEERITDRIKLEKVLGVTVPSNAALGTDNNGIVAYPAGCTVVLFNSRTEQQNHIINISRKTVTSLAYSSCGRYIVTGECGHQPAVRVWDLLSEPQSGHPGLAPQPQQIAEFIGHKYGVNCVAFSPNNKYVVSVGTQHDMIVNVWDWKNNIKIASNKVSTKVKAIAFAENGSYFVTVGNRHVKFWFLETGKNKYKEAVPLMGRSAILGEQRNNYFCDVACGKGECGDSTYAITRSGLLCEFNNRRLLDKWVELRTTSANCITVGQKYIFVGCAEGIIRCFDPTTLRFVTTLPRCHYLGVDVTLGTNIQHMASPPADAKYPDTTAVSFDEANNKLTAVYNDHSLYIWDVFNIKRVGKSCSFLYHSACIWGVEMAPTNSPFPPGSFLTCSSDDTVRVWSLDKLSEKNVKGMYQQNIYSNELLKVVYVDKDLSYIKDLDISGTVSNEKQPDQTSYDGKNGVRCIRVSPDGKHLASGDRSGNIRIHDTSQMKELFKIEAHDSEVLCLEYCANDSVYNMLASASRDRLIHVFDTKHGYDFVQTLDDHSSSITAVRFLNHSNNIQMVSCGADKSLIFRSLGEFNGKAQFSRDNNATGKTTLYDMEVDTGQKHILTACQDRNVRIYSVTSGKHTKTFKGSTGDDGSLIKVVLDRSGIYLATSCTDKSLSVYDYYSGECMATMCGHSELATGLRFTNDCRRLISASGDGCIFVWRIPHDMVVTMQARLSQQAMRQGKMLETELFNDSTNFDMYDGNSNVDTNYRFSIGQLPQWAKKQLTEESSQPPSLNKGVAAPKGRWAQRAENKVGVQTFYSSQPLPFPVMEKRFDSDGSKDSSLDSGTEVKLYQETRKEAMTTTSKISPNVTIREKNRRGVMTDDSAIGDAESTAHDGDLDSDSEYRHRPLYYPSLADSPSGNEFTVTNMDADELRKSQRKKKTPQIVIQQPTTGSYDSEDDEDDASTPSGENTDRNPMSLFSVSSESLDQLVSRERYLQATFESMSGAETEHHTPSNKSSFSSKFLTNSGNRNIEAINAVKQTRSDPEAMKKRQELSKRIAETKKKLESVGHSSPLKYSQSIHDLSHIPERDKWSKKQADSDSTNMPTNSTTTDATACSVCTVNRADYVFPAGKTVSYSRSVPTDLQLCGCYMSDIERNTINLNRMLGLSDFDRDCAASDSGNFSQNASKITKFLNLSSITSSVFDRKSKVFRESLEQATKSPERNLNELIRPRKLKLDKTLTKYKMHKSLPVSPVSEERQFADYVEQKKCGDLGQQRQSFSGDIGERKRPLPVRVKEHLKHTQRGETSRSGIAEHVWENQHHMPWSEAKILSKEHHWRKRKFIEAAYINQNTGVFSKPSIDIPNIWKPLLAQNKQLKLDSYFLDFESKSTDEGFKQVCSDIEKFSQDFSKKYDQIEKSFIDKNVEKSVKNDHTDDPVGKDKPVEDDESNFSSDSLEDYNFFSFTTKKSKKSVPPRRCVSNNEIYRYQEEYIEEIPKSESFYLNQNFSIQGSQESLLSDENNLDYTDFYTEQAKSYCNSLESVLSNDSDCKSAPLEVLFEDKRKQLSSEAKFILPHSQSLPKNISYDPELSSSLPKNFVEHNYTIASPDQYTPSTYPNVRHCSGGVRAVDNIDFIAKQSGVSRGTTELIGKRGRGSVKTCQTQTDFETPQEIVAKKSRGSEDFQKKLLKFESSIAQASGKKPVAFFVETTIAKHKPSAKISKENVPLKIAKTQKTNNQNLEMFIPSLAQKNKQYKSKFCNVLNNRPDQNIEIFEEKGHNRNNGNSFTLSTINFEKNTNRNNVQETSSLDRHLFAKGLLNNSEKITHKPPKAVRRNSSKNKKSKTTYEYIRKEDFYKNTSKDVDDLNIGGNKSNFNFLNNRKREFQELVLTGENTIELCFKETNVDCEVEASSSVVNKSNRFGLGLTTASTSKDFFQTDQQNTILTELYDSLDKKSPPSKMDLDSLDVNLLNTQYHNYPSDPESAKNLFDSLEVNVWSKNSCMNKNAALQLENVLMKQAHHQGVNEIEEECEKSERKHSPQDKIAIALQNIKILNEIQRKIHKINTLVDIYRKNVSKSKVKALSSMYESLTTSQSYYNDLTKLQATPVKYRRRNLSLPSFVERRLNFECKNGNSVKLKGDVASGETKISEVYLDDTSSPDSSLRRSCSLSDLSMQNMPTVAKRKQSEPSKKPAPPARMTPRYVKNNSMMRSKSSVVLNQQHSDSENDSQEKKMSRLMRPTISSHNKIRDQKSLQSRKKQSYSTSNLNQIGVDIISTSDDEELPKKPQVPPRMSRQQSFENGQNSKRLMNNKDQKRASRHSIHFDDTLTNEDVDLSSESIDLSSIEFSNQLCEDVSRQLVSTADNVVKIYQKLKENEEAGDSQSESLDCIKMSLIRTHKVVHDCIFNEFKQNNGNIDVNQTDAIKKLNDLVSKGASGSGSVIDLMQQYSDILLDMMQQKIHSANII